MTLKLLIICEAQADFVIASELADRVLISSVEWVEPELLDSLRRYRGYEDSDRFLTWAAAKRLSKDIPIFGHFNGQPGELDAKAARNALALIGWHKVHVDAVIMIRDSDGELKRREGLEQARRDSKLAQPIVIGFAHTTRECWVLAGFEPANDEEHSLLVEARQQLGFDPRDEAHQLTAKHETDNRSAKRVLKFLTRHEHTRERDCWFITDLGRIRSRGERTGVSDYLTEIEERVVPLFVRSSF